MANFSIPKIFEKEIKAVVDAGYYSNRSEVVSSALRNLFNERSYLRVAAAVQLYKEGEISLSRGAELADMSIPDFKEILEDRSVKIETPGGSREELDEGVGRLKEALE